MKTLRLVGTAVNGDSHQDFLVASITYSAPEDHITVDSSLISISEAICSAIDEYLARAPFSIFKVTTSGPKDEPHTYKHSVVPVAPADETFLEAMLASEWFWDARTFAGYKVRPLRSYIEDV